MSTTAPWAWETHRGSAGELHRPDEPPVIGRLVREMVVNAPAIVLGSSQSGDDVDVAKARSAGVAIERRRSGGGAVLLVPGDHHWLDVWLPAGDPLWVDDVGRAGDWLADAWVETLRSLGRRDLVAHRGPLVTTDWSSQVCFAGLGPGEVTAGGRKIVGVSQRRTRGWVRFQCLIHRRWDPQATFGLLTDVHAAQGADAWRAGVVEIGDAPIRAAFETVLAAV